MRSTGRTPLPDPCAPHPGATLLVRPGPRSGVTDLPSSASPRREGRRASGSNVDGAQWPTAPHRSPTGLAPARPDTGEAARRVTFATGQADAGRRQAGVHAPDRGVTRCAPCRIGPPREPARGSPPRVDRRVIRGTPSTRSCRPRTAARTGLGADRRHGLGGRRGRSMTGPVPSPAGSAPARPPARPLGGRLWLLLGHVSQWAVITAPSRSPCQARSLRPKHRQNNSPDGGYPNSGQVGR